MTTYLIIITICVLILIYLIRKGFKNARVQKSDPIDEEKVVLANDYFYLFRASRNGAYHIEESYQAAKTFARLNPTWFVTYTKEGYDWSEKKYTKVNEYFNL